LQSFILVFVTSVLAQNKKKKIKWTVPKNYYF